MRALAEAIRDTVSTPNSKASPPWDFLKGLSAVAAGVALLAGAGIFLHSTKADMTTIRHALFEAKKLDGYARKRARHGSLDEALAASFAALHRVDVANTVSCSSAWHARLAVRLTRPDQLIPPLTTHLLFQLGCYMLQRREYGDARAIFASVLAHRTVATAPAAAADEAIGTELGDVEVMSGGILSALSLYQSVTAATRQSMGVIDTFTASIVDNNLAITLFGCGLEEEAQKSINYCITRINNILSAADVNATATNLATVLALESDDSVNAAKHYRLNAGSDMDHLPDKAATLAKALVPSLGQADEAAELVSEQSFAMVKLLRKAVTAPCNAMRMLSQAQSMTVTTDDMVQAVMQLCATAPLGDLTKQEQVPLRLTRTYVELDRLWLEREGALRILTALAPALLLLLGASRDSDRDTLTAVTARCFEAIGKLANVGSGRTPALRRAQALGVSAMWDATLSEHERKRRLHEALRLLPHQAASATTREWANLTYFAAQRGWLKEQQCVEAQVTCDKALRSRHAPVEVIHSLRRQLATPQHCGPKQLPQGTQLTGDQIRNIKAFVERLLVVCKPES